MSLDRPAPEPWQSVHFAGEPPGREALEAAGIRIAAVDGAAILSKQDLMEALSAALEFPDYFGGNWDALEEVLRDLGWLEAKGHVVVIESGEDAVEARPRADRDARAQLDRGGGRLGREGRALPPRVRSVAPR